MSNAFSSFQTEQIFGPKVSVGEVVNVHVVSYVPERQPDFAAMQRVIAGGTSGTPSEVARRDDPNREISA
jgi:hypothetical protein